MSWFGWLTGRRREEDDAAQDEAGVAEPFDLGMPAATAKKGGLQLPRFHGNANDKTRKGVDSSIEQIRFRLRNGFTPSRPVLDADMFAGRRTLLTNLIRSIEDQQLHVVLFGARGVGKTSTLHILRQIATDAHYVVRYASCGEQVHFDDMFRAILNDIPLLYHADYEPTADEIEEGLTFSSLIGDAPLTVSQVSEILSHVSGTRVLIVLDEFDRVSTPDFRRSIAELIKNLSDRASRVQLVIAGVASNLNDLIEQIPSIRRVILGIPVPVMSDEELAQMIRIGERESGLSFSTEASALVFRLASGLPYLCGLICLHAGLSALDRKAVVVGTSDVWAGVRQAFEEISLRVLPETRHAFDRAVAGGHGADLHVIAHSALRAGGLVIPASDTDTGERTQSSALFHQIAGEYRVIAPLPNDPQGAYTFLDEGAPLYFWMRDADKQASEAMLDGGTDPAKVKPGRVTSAK